jgi:hypothetical protein
LSPFRSSNWQGISFSPSLTNAELTLIPNEPNCTTTGASVRMTLEGFSTVTLIVCSAFAINEKAAKQQIITFFILFVFDLFLFANLRVLNKNSGFSKVYLNFLA